jgi:hypothetical protein
MAVLETGSFLLCYGIRHNALAAPVYGPGTWPPHVTMLQHNCPPCYGSVACMYNNEEKNSSNATLITLHFGRFFLSFKFW